LLRLLNVFAHGSQTLSFYLVYKAIPFLGKPPYDIIHCHFGSNGIYAKNLRKLGIVQGKLVTAFHGYDISLDLRKYGDFIYNSLFEAGDLFLPISACWQNRLIQLGCDPQKIKVLRMGIDCRLFQFTPRGINGTRTVQILTIGRFVEKKGIEYGIRAVAVLVSSGYRVKYKIIGDGPLRNSLQRLVEELQVSQHVLFLGWQQQEEVAVELAAADILLAPSVTSRDGDQEGIPVVLMEAMAMGLPVVSTLHSGIPELAQNGISGFLVPERDVDALASTLRYLIDHPEIWPQMGKAGREFVEKHYNAQDLQEQLEALYSSLLQRTDDVVSQVLQECQTVPNKAGNPLL
jgi:colanic acid/amylovoran biosynthesis glycosyltransferase